jgi:hypothetical protein
MQVLPCYSYLQLFKNGKRSAPMNIKKIKKMPSMQQHENALTIILYIISSGR